MKLLSKINRGVILTVAVILTIVIYLIATSIYNSSQKPILEDLSKQYIEVYLEYELLPQEHRVQSPDIPENEFNDFVEELTDELKEFYPGDDNYYKFSLQNKIGNLTDQMNGQGVITSYSKSIIKFEEFIFSKNSVDVKVSTLTSIEYYDPYNPSAQDSVKITQEVEDQIIFQKFDGEWKVVYSNINRPFNEGGPKRVFG